LPSSLENSIGARSLTAASEADGVYVYHDAMPLQRGSRWINVSHAGFLVVFLGGGSTDGELGLRVIGTVRGRVSFGLG
jgi:hypothetical protein